MTENIITENTQVKKRGRPKKVITEPLEPIEKKALGRPKTLLTDEDRLIARTKNAKKSYENRGNLVAKIHSLKKNYGLEYPNREDYEGKSNDVLIELIKKMNYDIANIQYNKAIEKLNQTNFKPKSKYFNI